jgi:hypothetical protein
VKLNKFNVKASIKEKNTTKEKLPYR